LSKTPTAVRESMIAAKIPTRPTTSIKVAVISNVHLHELLHPKNA
jgi:hypothetical protein